MMLSKLKSIKKSLYLSIFPKLYKKNFYKKLASLNWVNIQSKNIENELLLIQYFLGKDSVFIDVGANLGHYIYKAEQIIESHNIHAFEPHPVLNKQLKTIFKGVHIYQKALSDKISTAQFKIPYFNKKEVHTRGTLKIDSREEEETSFKLIDVNISTLDTLVIENNLKKISLIKIDVEGAEFEVINGAKSLIQQYQPILIIEIEQRHHDTPILNFIEGLEKSGDYTCFYFDTLKKTLKSDIAFQDISVLQSQDNHGNNRKFINNFIFIPNEKIENGYVKNIHEQINKESKIEQ